MSDTLQIVLPTEITSIYLPEISSVQATNYYTASDTRITESSDTRITEDGDTRVTETLDVILSYPELMRLQLPDEHITVLLEDQ